MDNNEIYRKALARIARNRQQAVTLALDTKEEIYSKIPALKKLEHDITLCGFESARLAASGADTTAKSEQQQKLAALVQQKAQLLEQNGFTPADLEPKYNCSLCKDGGYGTNGKLCSCVSHVVRTMRLAEMNAAAPLTLSSFDTFSLDKYPNTVDKENNLVPRQVMQTVFTNCVNYAKNFKSSYPSLMLIGESGLGKTHLALAIAGYLMPKGINVVYVSAQNAFSQIEKEKFSGNDTLDALLTAQLLILDDLGTEFLSPYIHSCLYNVVNTRLNAQRPTIYTSNIVNETMLRARYTDKIASRLLGGCKLLYFFGNDIRLQNK
ncbi:MAG: ATP-binding protein [Oscillospiraceae bacterium]|nr:ATP-binding protein [Oscillospiraceae bacterium]